MGIAAAYGVTAAGIPVSGDKANAVVSGAFAGIGASQPFVFEGPMNMSIWASLVTTLNTTQGSNVATVSNGAGIAAGTAINSVNVPPGTTWASFSGTSGTLAFPTVTLEADANTASPILRGLRTTTGLLGATVTGPGIPPGTTVLAIAQPAGANNSSVPLQVGGPGAPLNFGQVQLSNTPTSAKVTTGPSKFSFALTAQAVATGADPAAAMTGAGITYGGTIQIERSFDGCMTWLPCNSGGGGALAQYNSGTPVNLTFGEPELQVYYRLNCLAYSSGPINYRISETGGAATSLNLGTPI